MHNKTAGQILPDRDTVTLQRDGHVLLIGFVPAAQTQSAERETSFTLGALRETNFTLAVRQPSPVRPAARSAAER
ncbi:hypothetical protein AAHS21_03415 [Mycobacterium sp. 050272]|uniref:hypothetical protein n=1 Tax=Mycobacterium sp. 050272 TaxID=3142488 RepID=UPI00319C5B72